MDKHPDYKKIEAKAAAGKTALNVVVYIMLVFWAVMVLFPFYWMVLTSLKGYGAYNAEHIPKFFTLAPTLENYAQAFPLFLWRDTSLIL